MNSAIEWLPVQPAGAILGLGFANFQRSQIRRAAREPIVDRWYECTRVDSLGTGFQPKIEVHRVINGVARGRIRRLHLLEDIEIYFDTMLLLPGGGLEVGQGAKSLPIGRFRL